ncbi:MAG: hypothetical protein K2R98_18435 [Gemmataceae bacterium]|nr:hypothetical protein [Gemmataceae bacterium]
MNGFRKLGLQRLSWILLYCVSAIPLFSGLRTALNPYDEGLSASGAVAVLDGAVPYRDLWTNYAPGQYYALGFLFWVFGRSLLVLRVYNAIWGVIAVVLACALARRLAPAPFVLLPGMVVTLLVGALIPGTAALPALVLSLVSCLYLAWGLSGSVAACVFAGIAAGATTFFRHDFGFYTFAAESVVLGAAALGAWWRGESARERAYFMFALLGGMAAILVPLGLFLISHVTLHELLEHLLRFPGQVYPKVRRLPYPAFPNPGRLLRGEETLLRFWWECAARALYYFPWVVFSLAAVRLVRAGLTRSFTNRDWFAFLLLVAGLAYFNYGRVRSDDVHIIPMAVFAVVLSGYVVHGLIHGGFRARNAVVRLSLGALVLFLVAWPGVHKCREIQTGRMVFRTPLGLEAARGVRGMGWQQAVGDAIRYVDANVPPGEAIFVGNTRHDVVWINDAMFYFLAQRPSATKYLDLHPGLVTTRPVQQEIIQALAEKSIRCVVLWEAPLSNEPNDSARNEGETGLDDYIRSHFRIGARFGLYTVHWRTSPREQAANTVPIASVDAATE